MKKPLKSYFPLLLSLCLLFAFPFQAMSAKQNKNNDNGEENANNTKVLKVINRDGDSVVDGSVLNPRDDEIHIYLQQLLSVLKKGDLSKLSIVLTSAVDSTKTFSVPREAISVQKRKIGKKSAKYLVVSLFNLTTPAGIIVSPSALPTDKYRLRIVSKKNEIATDSFYYRTPVLLVGKVKDSDGKGLVNVEDLEGGLLSDKTVAINPDGIFITEVKVGKILEAKTRLKSKKDLKTLKAQEVIIEEESATGENDLSSSSEENTTNSSDDSYIGVIHAVTDTDLFAIAPLKNNTEFNTSVASKPIEVSEASTLATTLAKEGAKEELGDLAGDVADDKLKDLQGSEETSEPEDIGCDIEQFASLCSEVDFNTVGSEFRKFVAIAKCSFSEFDVLKKFLSNAPEDANNFIGRGYCSYVDSEVNENKPCEAYSGILAEHKAGKIKQLPCPPSFCKEFSGIKSPTCVEFVGDFCKKSDNNSSLSSQVCRGSRCISQNAPVCLHKPVKDLFCAEVGQDISSEECKDEGFEFADFSPNWTVVKNSEGNEYCVPSNLPPNTPKVVNVAGTIVEITPEVIAEECEINRCHNECANEFGFTSPIDPLSIKPGSELEKSSLELNNCHFACDAEAGRVVDCGNPKSKYFSNKCCANNFAGPVLYTKTDLLAQTSNFDLSGFSNTDYGYGSEFSGSNASGYGGFGSNYNGPGRGPIFNDIRGCLCEDFDNFDDKGFIEEGAAEFCNDSCPLDYEKDPNSEYCLPICQVNEVRDPKGFCRKKCQPGFIEDAVGNCKCPEGKVIGRSGKCEDLAVCPDYCRSYPLYRELLARHDLGSFSNNSGTSTSTTSSVPISTGLPSPLAGSSQPLISATATSAAGSGNTSYSGSTTGAIPPECQKCLLGSNNVCPSGQRYDSFTNQCVSNVSCGVDQYSDSTGVCKCNFDGSIATSLGPEGCKKQNYCTGNMYPNPNANQPNQSSCICPSGLPYWDNNQGYCVAQCPIGSKPNSGSYFSNAPIPCEKTQTECPPTTPIKCSDGRCAVTQLECSTQCPLPFVSNPTGNPPCICPSSTPITYNGTCVATCPSGLTADYPYVSPSTSGASLYASPLTCLCPNKTYPNANGTCSHTCAPGELSSSSNPCTCTGGGYFGSGNTCQCTSGQTYTITGCSSTTTCPSLTPIRCSDGTCVVAAANCPLTGTPATPSALTATVSTSQSGNILLAWTDNATNEDEFKIYRRPQGSTPFIHIGSTARGATTYIDIGLSAGTYEYHVDACNASGCSTGYNSTVVTVTSSTSCPAGQVYSGGVCIPELVTFNSVSIDSSNNVTVSYSKNFNTCVHLLTSSNTITHTQNHFCTAGNNIVLTPLTSFNSSLKAGTQVKLCHENNYSLCSSLVTVTTSSPTPTPTPSPTPQPITLNSAVINNGNTISLNYSQVSNEGTKLKTIDNINLHAYNFSFGVFSSGTEFPLPWFYSNLMAGTQIKLCHVLNSSVCSQPVTVTESSIRTCNAGETSSLTSASPCKCTLYGSPNQYSNYTCSCGNGRTYSSITGCGTHICASGEVFNFNDQCACAAGAKFDQLTNKCICLSGQTYTASGCISSIPNAPATLTTSFSSSNPGVVTLTWTDNSTNEDSFKIYRRLTGSSTWTLVTNVGPNIITYTDSGLSPGSYEYHINACNASGCSVDSVSVSVTVTSRITLSSATVSSGIITYNFTKDSTDCLNLYTSGGTLINIPSYCHGGVSGVGYPLSTLNNNLQPGISVKLCYNLDPTVCSNLVTLGGSFTTHTCAPNETYSSTNICNCASGASPNLQNICACSGSNIYTTTGCQVPQVTVNSVVINPTDSTVSVSYSKNFNDCVTLKYSNSNTAAHSGDLFCINTGNVNIPLSTFNQTKFQNSVNVKLCNSTGTCSSITQVSGPNICVPGGSPTSGTCSCFSPAGPDQNDTYKRCACPLGSIYTNSNGASFCRRYCNVEEIYYGLSNSDQCSCGVYGSATSSSPCTCSNGNTYNSQTACGADQHI